LPGFQYWGMDMAHAVCEETTANSLYSVL
jgi:hypothetical protein